MDATNAQTCRTCLAENAANLGLNCIMQNCPSSRTYKEILQELTQIQIMDELEFQMPQNICSSCYKQLQIAYNFIRKSQECNQKLLEMFSKHVQADDGMEKVEYVIVKQEDDEQFLMDMVQDIRNEPVQMSIVKEEKILENEQMEEASCSNINKVVEDYDENSKSLTENSSHMFSDNPCDDDDDEYIPDKDDEEYIPDKEFTKPNELDKRNISDTSNNPCSTSDVNKTNPNVQDEILKTLQRLESRQNTIAEKMDDRMFKLQSTVDQLLRKHAPLGTNKIFPINNLDELKDAEKEVSLDIAKYSQIIKVIIEPDGLFKNFSRIFSDNVIHQLNYNGVNNKVSFKEYKSLNEALFGAITDEGTSQKDFIQELRKCFRIYKSRIFKKQYDQKRKNVDFVN